MKILRRLYGYLRHYKTWAIVAFGSMIVFALTQTVLAALVRPIIDDVLSPPRVQRTVAANERTAGLERALARYAPPVLRAKQTFDRWWSGNPAKKWRRVLTLLLFVFVVRALSSFFSEYAFQKVGLSTVRDLRNQLYERIIFQSHRFFSERSTGEMVSRVVSDADAIQAAVSTRMGDLFQESLTLFFLLAYVFWTNPELALITFIVAPVMVYPVVHFGRRLRGTTHRSQERMADMATLLEETIRGVRIVKAFTMERFEIGRFHIATKRHLSSNLKAQKIQALSSPVMDLVTGFGALAIFVYAQRRIANGTLSMG